MSPRAAARPRHAGTADCSAAVDAFMATLDHPAKAAIQHLRSLLLGADPGIAEGIKWNAPSFRTHEYFATVHLRQRPGLVVILHLGAKARDLGPGAMAIADPAALLHWLEPDRAQVVFADLAELEVRSAEFVAVVRGWIGYV